MNGLTRRQCGKKRLALKGTFKGLRRSKMDGGADGPRRKPSEA